MTSMHSLLQPRGIAVIGASQRGGRGTKVLTNLREAGFAGDVYAVNPRYGEIAGFKCFASVADLPASIECVVVAVAADAACDVLEEAYRHGIRGAVILTAGFGEGGHGGARVERLKKLAAGGMAICGPNCFGLIAIAEHVASFSGVMPNPLLAGKVALVSQSGGLANNSFIPLMQDRGLGFSHLISCGNQIGTTIEDYIDYLNDDAETEVIAVIVESVKNPPKLQQVARVAHQRGKSLIFYQVARSNQGKLLVQSHTGALVGDSNIVSAFLRRCGIVEVDSFDEFVETIELFAHAPRDRTIGQQVIAVSSSGGGSAIAADVLSESQSLCVLSESTKDGIARAMPDFGSVTNPIDGTGAVFDDRALMAKLFDAIMTEPGRPIIAASVIARQGSGEGMRHLARTYADIAKKFGRTLVAYQPTPLGGPLDPQIVGALHGAGVPLLLGTSTAMKALKYLPLREAYEAQSRTDAEAVAVRAAASLPLAGMSGNFLAQRDALMACGVAVVDSALALTEDEAIAAFRRFGRPVVVKAEAEDLIHKSDIGCVRLGCASDAEVAAAFREVGQNAKAAGFADPSALLQPMTTGVAEFFAGVTNDPAFGPAVTVGTGGIFVEILSDVVTEMAPVSFDEAMRMINHLKGVKLLKGARGREPGDIAALAELVAGLSRFAVAQAGCFSSLDINPIIVGPVGQGACAVDIAIETPAVSCNKP